MFGKCKCCEQHKAENSFLKEHVAKLLVIIETKLNFLSPPVHEDEPEKSDGKERETYGID